MISLTKDNLDEFVAMGAAKLDTDAAQQIIQMIKTHEKIFRTYIEKRERISAITGYFEVKGARQGVYINSSIFDVVPEEITVLYKLMHNTISSIFNDIIIHLGLNDSNKIRTQEETPHDTLIIATYPETSDKLDGHCDFGILTIAIADKPGMRIKLPNGEWYDQQEYDVIVHMNTWFEVYLRERGVKTTAAYHEVSNVPAGRLFCGMFYSPDDTSVLAINGEEISFKDFLIKSLDSLYHEERSR